MQARTRTRQCATQTGNQNKIQHTVWHYKTRKIEKQKRQEGTKLGRRQIKRRKKTKWPGDWNGNGDCFQKFSDSGLKASMLESKCFHQWPHGRPVPRQGLDIYTKCEIPTFCAFEMCWIHEHLGLSKRRVLSTPPHWCPYIHECPEFLLHVFQNDKKTGNELWGCSEQKIFEEFKFGPSHTNYSGWSLVEGLPPARRTEAVLGRVRASGQRLSMLSEIANCAKNNQKVRERSVQVLACIVMLLSYSP